MRFFIATFFVLLAFTIAVPADFDDLSKLVYEALRGDSTMSIEEFKGRLAGINGGNIDEALKRVVLYEPGSSKSMTRNNMVEALLDWQTKQPSGFSMIKESTIKDLKSSQFDSKLSRFGQKAGRMVSGPKNLVAFGAETAAWGESTTTRAADSNAKYARGFAESFVSHTVGGLPAYISARNSRKRMKEILSKYTTRSGKYYTVRQPARVR
ncbi:hypothetical protein O9G_003137 [Rozella allomycis CSF55]|uniref:Uncharacterized protein n=1 Tax=Rozella allomycis (strain CSF55) TaxID=988480 RepID=A0A075ANH0_ROZAC|nr:hypothetical protein O9G_003137 [Rozella allomycis CSF55]|eukprot:EPZ31415.1 hypothetical protein O9G_003137 [Rozella allomycis CSF55]